MAKRRTKTFKNWKIISVGGSVIIPKTGFNIEFLKAFRELIISHLQRGERFILIIGGGATARSYQAAGREVAELAERELDWLGIYATQLNALFVRHFFGSYAEKKVITDPRRRVKTVKHLLIAAGWKPGCSTDYDTVLLAKTYGVKYVINLSNISHVYDRDPNLYPAKKIEQIDWPTFRREIVGNKWEAGKSAPFDPVASRAAERLGLTVAMVEGTNLEQVDKAIAEEKFVGTVIHP